MRRLYEDAIREGGMSRGRKGLQEEENDDRIPQPPNAPYLTHCRGAEDVPVSLSVVGTEEYSHLDADIELAAEAIAPPVPTIGAHDFGSQHYQPPPVSIHLTSSNGNNNNASPDMNQEEVSVMSDISGDRTHVVEAFTREEMADQLRKQLRTEMQQELHANVVTAQVLEEAPESTDESTGFWTRRKVLCSTGILLLVVVGVVAGVTVAVTGSKEQQENYLNEVFTFNGTDEFQGGDEFGYSVALSGDGSTFAATAKEGHYLKVYRQDYAAGTWNQHGQTLDFEHQQDGKFETALDLNQDGSILAIGQWNNDDAGAKDAGYAVAFWFNGTGWTQLGNSMLGSGAKDHFGQSVALAEDGRTIAVGTELGGRSSNLVDAGYARVFALRGIPGEGTVEWIQLGTDLKGIRERDHFGMNLALSANGRRIAVGAQGGVERKGRVSIFDYTEEGNWTQVGKSIEGEHVEDDADKVVISGDGSIIVIAASGDDASPNVEGYRRTYKREGSTWVKHGEDLLGRSKNIALSSDSSCLLIGDSGRNDQQGRGELYRWNNDDMRWSKIAVTIGEKPADRFGGDVTIDGNCSVFGLGATRANSPGSPPGYARVYEAP